MRTLFFLLALFISFVVLPCITVADLPTYDKARVDGELRKAEQLYGAKDVKALLDQIETASFYALPKSPYCWQN